jgi:soluble lytic murein transglycosylase-like protein
MPSFRVRFLVAVWAMFACSAVTAADMYGKVENGRVSILYSDRQPDDKGYVLFMKERTGQITLTRRGQAAVTTNFQPTGQNAPRVVPSQFHGHILAAAKETNVEPALIRAVINVESGYNPRARSHAGAVGLMQLMPGTAQRYGVTNRLDPEQNIRGGARYLRDLKAMFNNNLQLVLAAYNAGEQAVIRYGKRIPPFRETVEYVPKVLSHYKKYRAADL